MNILDNSVQGHYDIENVLISGEGGTKRLGAPAIPHNSTELAGTLIADATIKLLAV